MTDENLALFREFLVQRLDALEARMDSNRADTKEQISGLLSEIKQQRSDVGALKDRCEMERGNLWCAVHSLEAHDREEGARRNGLAKASEGRARFWMVMGAVAGGIYALMFGLSLYVKYAFGVG